MNLRTREGMIAHLKSLGYKVTTWTQEDRHKWLIDRGWYQDIAATWSHCEIGFGLSWDAAVRMQIEKEGWIFETDNEGDK